MKVLKLLGVLALVACSKSTPEFRVSADLPQLGTQTVNVVYSTDDGNRHALSVTAVDGKFEFSGSAEAPSTIEIFTSKHQLYAAIVAQNGDDITLTGTPGEFKAEGNELAQQLLDYTEGSDTAGLPAEVRRAIESLYLTATLAPAKFVSPEVFIKNDSVFTFPPEGIWIFTSEDNQRTPALLDTLRHYAKQKELNLRDVFIGSDMWQWKTLIRRDSATWTQVLSPDAPVTLGGIITTTPLLVEVDTAGTVIRTLPL